MERNILSKNNAHEVGTVQVEGSAVSYMIDMERGGSTSDLSFCMRRLADIIKSKGACPIGWAITSNNGYAMVRTANRGC